MRHFYTFLIVLLISFNSSYAQCARVGDFQDGPTYSLSGNATIDYATDTYTLSFSGDFGTTGGPDLVVYLSNSSQVSTPGGVLQTPETIELQLLKSASGAQTYDLTSVINNLDQYDYVVIHCRQFNHPWGYAFLGAKNSCDQTSLSIDNESLTENKVYPTYITNGKINITSDKGTDINIFSLNGTLIKALKGTDESEIYDLSFLNSGIYLLQSTQNNILVTTRILIK